MIVRAITTLALLAIPVGLGFLVFQSIYRRHVVQREKLEAAMAARHWTMRWSVGRFLWQVTGTFSGKPFEATCTRPAARTRGGSSTSHMRATVTVTLPGSGMLLEPRALALVPAFVRKIATPFAPPGTADLRSSGTCTPLGEGQWGEYQVWRIEGATRGAPGADTLRELQGYISGKVPVMASWWDNTLTVSAGGSTVSDPLPLLALAEALTHDLSRS